MAPKTKPVAIYGIWSVVDEDVVEVSLSEEDIELKFDINYDEKTHYVVRMDVILLLP